MFLTDDSLIYRGIRPLQKLGNSLSLSNPFLALSMPQRIPEQLLVIPPDPWAGDANRGRDMLAGVFRFSGQTIEKDAISWMPENARAEWIADLHSFEWLRDLRSVGGARARHMARDMIASWMDRHQKFNGPEGAADVTGMRIAAWMAFHDFFCASAMDDFRNNYFTSLMRQARHLSKSISGNLTSIPLMRALKGLAFCGLALEECDEYLMDAITKINEQIREQILPDGAHVSRNGQTTFEFLQCLVDVRTAIYAARQEMPVELQHAIDRIVPAVKFFRHGDGTFSHFNGAQEGNANICDATLMHSGARGRAMKNLPHSGYEKIQMGRAMLFMDVGLPVISQYSDRTHAGILGFEYSYGKDRVIVNCGSSNVSGRWRDLLRSTAAHSTLIVDHRNACTFDDAGFLKSAPDVRARYHEEKTDGAVAMIEASHTGYVPRYGLTHLRNVRVFDGGDSVRGEDTLQGKAGSNFAVRFHLHPSVHATYSEDGEEITLRARSGMTWLFRNLSPNTTFGVEDSIYGAAGETPSRTQQIVIHGVTAADTTQIVWEMIGSKKSRIF